MGVFKVRKLSEMNISKNVIIGVGVSVYTLTSIAFTTYLFLKIKEVSKTIQELIEDKELLKYLKKGKYYENNNPIPIIRWLIDNPEINDFFKSFSYLNEDMLCVIEIREEWKEHKDKHVIYENAYKNGNKKL